MSGPWLPLGAGPRQAERGGVVPGGGGAGGAERHPESGGGGHAHVLPRSSKAVRRQLEEFVYANTIF